MKYQDIGYALNTGHRMAVWINDRLYTYESDCFGLVSVTHDGRTAKTGLSIDRVARFLADCDWVVML